ncbi:hypothetical protein BD408DRAFT_125657 [Parasitella parasitica]|nr:hypothetical protein BD408DRAFT_125657 [Parasitella parasitica]
MFYCTLIAYSFSLYTKNYQSNNCLISCLSGTTLWSFKPGHSLTPQSEAFLEIIKHSLCSFHLVCRTVPEFTQNHERTHLLRILFHL